MDSPLSSGNRRVLEVPFLFQPFSLIGTNGTLSKLFEMQSYKPTDCLNGVRVLSMLWIILGHTFMMPEGISGYMNPEDITVSSFRTNPAEANVWFMVVMSAEAGVDTFFYLSGFLLSYLTLKELSRGAKVNPLMATALRYLRLTPSLALAMLIYYKILAFLGNGPFAPQYQDSINRRCDGAWWTELAYTLNFMDGHGTSDSDKATT